MEESHKIHGFVHFKRDKISMLYEDLNEAIKEKNTKNIWELSKVITRHHFSNQD